MDIHVLANIDRQILYWTNGSDSIFLDKLMLALTSGYTWIPLYLALIYLVIKNNETMGQIFLIIGCAILCVVLAGGVDDYIVKPLVRRDRPLNSLDYKQMIDTVEGVKCSGYSFFSAHAANTCSLAVFFILLVRNRLLSCTLLLWTLVNGYTRLYLGVHYPSDVLVGFVWGAFIGVTCYALCRYVYFKISPHIHYVSTQYTSTGYGLDDINIVLNIMAFTLCYVIFRAIL